MRRLWLLSCSAFILVAVLTGTSTSAVRAQQECLVDGSVCVAIPPDEEERGEDDLPCCHKRCVSDGSDPDSGVCKKKKTGPTAPPKT